MNNNTQPSVFGRSFQLVNGDLQLTERDFATISDRDNFLQAMKVIIETPFGTDIFNVNYGFDFLSSISKPQELPRIKDLIRLNIVKSLSRDDRVREIKEIVLNDDPRFFELNPDPNSRLDPKQQAEEGRLKLKSDPKLRRSWQAMLVLQTTQGDEIPIRLEGIGL